MEKKDKKELRTKLMAELGELQYRAIQITKEMKAINERTAQILPEIDKLD